MIEYSKQSREWLNANMSRAYPLDDSVGGAAGGIPTAALVDGFILTTGFDVGVYDFYISGIVNTGGAVLLSITASAGGSDVVEFKDAVAIHDIDNSAVIEFYADKDQYTICGSFTVGLASVLRSIPSNESLPITSTRIAPYVIHPVDRLCVTGIRVGDTLLTGEVTLSAGDGIILVPNEASNKINISAINYTPPAANTRIVDDSTLAEELLNIYGKPIISIADTVPDKDGCIHIAGDPEASSTSSSSTPVVRNYDYVVPEAGDAGSGVLYLKLERDPMLDEDYIESVTNNLVQLDARLRKVDSTVTAVDKVVASVSTQMTRLG